MTVHMIKLCVGADSIDDLADWQTSRLSRQADRGDQERLVHTTRMIPKRQSELCDGGSLFWVIRGVVQVRQAILGFDQGHKEDGTACCLIVLDPELVPVRPTPRRPFQGWRYLSVDDAPADLNAGSTDDLSKMPPSMRRELAELGLL